jgi:apolipoprotein N-acyltransferase
MQFALELVAILASAQLYGMSFPPDPHRALAWVAMVPFLVTLRQASAGRALLLAWLWTVAMAYAVNDWFPRAVSGYFKQPPAVGIALFVGVSTATAGVQYMLFATVYRRIASIRSAVAPLLAAAAWVAADLARLLLFGGDPWAVLGYSQVGVVPLMQIADATGVHGITFVVAAVNAALADLWCARSRAGGRLRAVAGCSLAALSVVVAFAYGTLRLRETPTFHRSEVAVGVVQAHLPLGAQWKREFYGRNLNVYLELTARLLRSKQPRIVFWPESSMTFFLADEPAYRRSIAATLEPFGAELVAGGPHVRTGPTLGYSNSAFLLAPDGEIRGRYDKKLLLPFAEYFPFAGFDLLRRSFGRVREFTPGDRAPLLPTSAGPVGVIICNEGFFPEPAAERVRDGAGLLVNLANDSWLGDPKYSEPAFEMVALRAVEQRRWIIRSSTAGPSALIDPFGRVLARTDLFTQATISGGVEPRTEITLYHRIGDAFAWGCVVATALAWLAAGRAAPMPRSKEDTDARTSRSAAA